MGREVAYPQGWGQRYLDEDILLESLSETPNGDIFPRAAVTIPPKSTPVYDFALTNRWFVQVTLQDSHAISVKGLANLVNRVGATANDPLHLVFFVADEHRAVQYSERGGENIGKTHNVSLTAEQREELARLVGSSTEHQNLAEIAQCIGVPDDEIRVKKKRKWNSAAESPTTQVASKLLPIIMSKLELNKSGTLSVNWERLRQFVNESGSTDQLDIAALKASVRQHVVAFVPVTSKTGDTAPHLSVSLIAGETFTLSDNKPTKYTVVFFYHGTHSSDCVDRIAAIEESFDDVEKEGVDVVAISMDSKENTKATINRVLKRMNKENLSLPMGYGLTEEVAREWGLSSVSVSGDCKFCTEGLFAMDPNNFVCLEATERDLARPDYSLFIERLLLM
eukprot:CAMPEP_0116546046 /NCGR_PEP_ID=MMETSP0397-20121206/3010_1 /TAXON_ID=216820 /ORGANISM="Cyclophora tenuis, Strain ECT3854" /LENGTH=393 /DNA_ID=CAMNT_0004070435 /DNA_START=99 /DNA_END=1280 /DNA_ORIENTATION=+